MRYFLWGLTLAVVVLEAAQDVIAQVTLQPGQAVPMSVSGRGYTLTPPLGWLTSKTSDDLVCLSFNSNKQNQPMIFIFAERLKKASTLKAAANKLFQQVQALHGFDLSAQSAITVDGVPGSLFTYSQKNGTPERLEKMSFVTVVRGNVVYTLMSSAPASGYTTRTADFNAVLQSLRWNDKNLMTKSADPLAAFQMTNQVYSEQTSPDGRTVATLAYHDGLTYGFEFLSLIPRAGWRPLQPNDPIPADEVAEMADEGINKVTWAGPHTLIVWYDRSTPKDCFVKRSKSWRNVRIVWKADPSR